MPVELQVFHDVRDHCEFPGGDLDDGVLAEKTRAQTSQVRIAQTWGVHAVYWREWEQFARIG